MSDNVAHVTKRKGKQGKPAHNKNRSGSIASRTTIHNGEVSQENSSSSSSTQPLSEQSKLNAPLTSTYLLSSWHPYMGLPSTTPAVLIFLFVFVVYAATSFRSVSGGDSGELIMTVYSKGVAHPPGYPTYTMLGFLATLLPVTPARAMNLLSCVLGAVAAACIYLTTKRISLIRSPFTAAAASVGFALSPTVWLYSGQAEVFALNNCLCAVLTWLTIRYFHLDEAECSVLASGAGSAASASGAAVGINDPDAPARASGAPATVTELFASAGVKPKPQVRTAPPAASFSLLRVGTWGALPASLREGLLGALFCGLAMTNQHTTVFYVFATAVAVALRVYLSGRLTPSVSAGFVLMVVLGMCPYLYMPIAAAFFPANTWGDQTTLEGFIRHFLRREYGTFQLAADGHIDPGMWSRLLRYADVTAEESSYVLLPLAAASLLFTLLCRCRHRAVWWWACTSVCAYASYMYVFHKLANLELTPLYLGVQARFWQQANLYVFIFGALGLELLVLTICAATGQLLRDKTAAAVVAASAQPSARAAVKIARVAAVSDALTRLPLVQDLLVCDPGMPQPTRMDLQQPLAAEELDAASVRAQPTRSRVSRVCRALMAAVVLTFCWWHACRHWPRMDQSRNDVLLRVAEDTLATIPHDAIVLLNGDLNHNILKYYHACEGVRPDLDMLSVQLMSWEWFYRQRRHFPRINWPGLRYHPFVADSFSMRAFLQANARREVVLCGSWKEGDPSLQGLYSEIPLGLCKLITPIKEEPRGDTLAQAMVRGVRGLPTLGSLGAFNEGNTSSDEEVAAVRASDLDLDAPVLLARDDPTNTPQRGSDKVKSDTKTAAAVISAYHSSPLPTLLPRYTADTWEAAWVGDSASQLRYLNSLLAMRASQNPQHTSLTVAAWRVHEYMLAGRSLTTALPGEPAELGPQEGEELLGERVELHASPRAQQAHGTGMVATGVLTVATRVRVEVEYLRALGHWSEEDERAGGVVYGMFSALAHRRAREADNQRSAEAALWRKLALDAEHKMLFLWARAVAAGKEDLRVFVERRHNPYSGTAVAMRAEWLMGEEVVNAF